MASVAAACMASLMRPAGTRVGLRMGCTMRCTVVLCRCSVAVAQSSGGGDLLWRAGRALLLCSSQPLLVRGVVFWLGSCELDVCLKGALGAYLGQLLLSLAR